ncbi:hypothetical protein [Thiomonas sp.]
MKKMALAGLIGGCWLVAVMAGNGILFSLVIGAISGIWLWAMIVLPLSQLFAGQKGRLARKK